MAVREKNIVIARDDFFIVAVSTPSAYKNPEEAWGSLITSTEEVVFETGEGSKFPSEEWK